MIDPQEFSLDKLGEDNYLEGYQLTPVGVGGEHIVYKSDTHSDVVIKVNGHLLLRVIEKKMAGITPNENDAKPMLNEKRMRHKQLRSLFGEEHVPNQKFYFTKVPVSKDIIASLAKHFHKDKDSTSITDNYSNQQVESVVTVQKKHSRI